VDSPGLNLDLDHFSRHEVKIRGGVEF
jgi:hypothetical protein